MTKVLIISSLFLSQYNFKFNIQDEFWNLEIKSFHLAPRFMGLNEKNEPHHFFLTKSDKTQIFNLSLLYTLKVIVCPTK